MTKVTNNSGIFLVIHIWFWALHYQDYWNSLTFFFVIAQIWHISILMISYPHYLNYSFLSFLELKKYHLSYQITQITKIVNLFQEQNDKIVTIVTNIIHRFFSFWKKLAHIEPCLLTNQGIMSPPIFVSWDQYSSNNFCTPETIGGSNMLFFFN